MSGNFGMPCILFVVLSLLFFCIANNELSSMLCLGFVESMLEPSIPKTHSDCSAQFQVL